MDQKGLKKYKHQLSYTTCNEDSLSEIRALSINSEDTVVCITGSGGRTLNLLTAQPKKIISIDYNPIQNWLLELKIAAIKNLEYEDYCRFLGLKECNTRRMFFDRLSGDLSQECKVFWHKQMALINKGILYQGKFERHYRLSSNFIKLLRRNKVKSMFAHTDLEEQKQYYHRHWDNRLWRFLLSLDSSKTNYKRTINDPAYYLYVDDAYDYKSFFHKSLEKAFTSGLANENHFLGLTIDGSYQRVKVLPLYLQEKHYACLKESIHRIEIVTDSMEVYLSKLENNAIDKFSVSDVGGYLDDKQFEKLFGEIIRTARNNGVFCTRNFIVKRDIPVQYRGYVKRNKKLEKNLEEQDLSFVYSFLAGQITK